MRKWHKINTVSVVIGFTLRYMMLLTLSLLHWLFKDNHCKPVSDPSLWKDPFWQFSQVSRAVLNVLVVALGGQILNTVPEAQAKIFGNAHKYLPMPTKLLLECVFNEISTADTELVSCWMLKFVCWFVTSDSRTFEDHQITSSVGIICQYGLACWGGGAAVAPLPYS